MPKPPNRLRAPSALLAAALASCAGSPPQDDGPTRGLTTTIRLLAGGLEPAAEVTIPARSTVAFHNGTRRVAMVAVEAVACTDGDGVDGFTATPGGVRSRPIAPDGVVSLRFDEPGRHTFAFAAAGNDRRGAIVVTAGQ